ncbi:MAG: hypothetical protein R6V50_06215 [Thermoplasmatota archaeon]
MQNIFASKKTVVVLLLLFVLVSSGIISSAEQKIQITEYDSSVVLITGFGPFHTYDVNPSELIAQNLSGQIIDDAEIVGIVLPVDFKESVEAIVLAIQQFKPVLVISLGLSPRSTGVDIETLGLNLKRNPLYEGGLFLPRRIDPKGPFIRLSTFDTVDIVQGIKNDGIATRQSFFAGMYICNTVLYETLGFINQYNLDIKAGFIHVPLLASQDPNGMELDVMIQAVIIAIQTSIK